MAEASVAAGAPLAGSVALVTGASRGTGAATALALARLGAHVVLTARTEGGLMETDDAIRAAGGAATLLPLDLRTGDAVDVIGPSLLNRFGRLDILVLAAATLGALTPAAQLLPATWTELVEVNLTAVQRLIRSTDPLLRAAPAGRAVALTCAIASEATAYWGGFGATKAGMEYLVRAWAAESRLTPLRVNLCDPGPVATRLRLISHPAEDKGELATAADVAPAIAALCLPSETRQGETIRLAPHPSSEPDPAI